MQTNTPVPAYVVHGLLSALFIAAAAEQIGLERAVAIARTARPQDSAAANAQSVSLQTSVTKKSRKAGGSHEILTPAVAR